MGILQLQVIVWVVVMAAMVAVVCAQDDIRQPPSIKKPRVAEDRFLPKGKDEKLQCEADGHPAPTYQWFFNDQLVSASNPPGGNVTYDSNTGNLTITNLSPAQNGVYLCHAKNTYATSVSPKTGIYVKEAGSWPNLVDRTVAAKVGHYLNIPCDKDLPEIYGEFQFKWYRNNDQKGNVKVPTDNRTYIDQQGTLHFMHFLNEDNVNNGGLSCAVSVKDITMGSLVTLSVSSGSLIKSRPLLEYSTAKRGAKGLTFEKGKIAILECVFSGWPYPTITWKDDENKPISNGKHYTIESNGRKLNIHNVTQVDEGIFTCEGSNSEGTDEGSMELNVTSAPMWVKPLEKQTVIQGTNAVLHCEAWSMVFEVAPEKPVWYKNGSPMNENYDMEKYVFSDQNRILTVMSAQKYTDIACFQCMVKNSVGEKFGDGCLNVLLPIVITTEPPIEQIIDKGYIVNLTVNATCDPLYSLTYTWIFKNKTYEANNAPPFVTYDVNTRVAYINTSGFTDQQMNNISGLYRRKVHHIYAHKFVDTEVKMEPEIGVAAAGFNFWIIGLIIALLIILIVFIICCCVICRRKMQEGDYPVDKKETAAGLDPVKEVKEGGFHDLSRADDPNQKVKPENQDIDGQSVRDDESFGSTEYGDEPAAFNEDGSFIGVYKSKPKRPLDNPAFEPVQPSYNQAFSHGSESMV